ncbi:MAG: amino acid permease [Nanoarchaeota archaeon]
MAELKKSMGYPAVIALTITAMIGTSMFFGVGIAAGIAGNASILSWIILSLITIYVATCFGELIGMFPVAGGVYEFTKRAYGRFTSFFVGWLVWIVGNITVAVIIVAAINYAFGDYTSTTIRMVAAIAIIIFFNLITYIGIEASSTMLIGFAVIALSLLMSIIVPGLLRFNPSHFKPFLTTGFPSIFLAIFFIIETYFGWESASFLSEETKNPTKVIPRALIWSTVAVTIIGLLLAVVTLSLIPFKELTHIGTPMTAVGDILYGVTGVGFINIAIIITLFGGAIGVVVSTPRLLLALARDKLFIEQFSLVSKKFRTPGNAILFQTIVTIIIMFVAFGGYRTLLSLLVPLALLMYAFVILCVPILRRKMPDAPRPYKTFGASWIPYLITLIYIYVVTMWAIRTPGAYQQIAIMAALILFAVPIYFLLNMFYNPERLIQLTNSSAWLAYLLENIILPKKVRNEILALHPELQSQTILELGAGVGTLTLHLAAQTGAAGKVYAVDYSKNNLRILSNRIARHKIRHVTAIHDKHMISRVHPDITRIDACFSVGFLSYVQDIKKVLKDISDIMPENGRIIFVDFVDLFYLIPNKPWISDRKRIEQEFREAGFSVKIVIKQRLFWKTVYIYGIKSDDPVPFL